MLLRQQYAWAGATVAVHVLGSFAMTVLGLASLRAVAA
jgi:fluoride ion exporter CrcB/FEX